MTSFVDDGWGDDGDLDGDLDVIVNSQGDDGWGEDDDFFGDDDGDNNEDVDNGFPPAAPAAAPSKSNPEAVQPSKEDDGWGEEDLDFLSDDDGDNKEGAGIDFPPAAPTIDPSNSTSEVIQPSKGDDGWGEEDLDFFSDDDGDNEEDTGLDFPPAAPTIDPPTTAPSKSTSEVIQPSGGDDGWGEEDLDFFSDDDGDKKEDAGLDLHPAVPTTTAQSHSISTQQSHHETSRNHSSVGSDNMLNKLSKYVESLELSLSSINAVLEFEYNTFQKAEELLEYYEKRPQLAEYTRTKELQRMDYQVVLPDGYVETDKERIIGENLLPDHAIVSRAANQSLLADVLQVITGQDLIARPQYLTVCIATWCKFVIHHGDHGADMIDCRARLSLSLPTAEGDRLSIAEVTVAVVFSPSQPMVEFKVIKIERLLEDLSKLSGVADFLSEMECGTKFPEAMDESPDIYRDAFLENTQRFFALSSEGMKSAFQQMDSVINLKGKMKSFSSFIPDTDQLLAAEQEAVAFAEARNMELKQQHEPTFRRPTFPRPPPPAQASFPRPPPPAQASFPRPPPPAQAPDQSQNNQNRNETQRPKSILGGLVRSGWKTLANSVAIPDDDPAIYGEYSSPDPQMSLYRREEKASDGGQRLYRKEETQNAPIPNESQESHMQYQRKGDLQRDIQGSNSFGSHGGNRHSQSEGNESTSGSGTTIIGQRDLHGTMKTDHEIYNELSNQPEELPESNREVGEEKDQQADAEEIDETFEDGWDDSFDGLDDVSDHIEESLDQHKTSLEQDPKGGKELPCSSDVVVVDPVMATENISPSYDTKYNEEDDVCDTRRRWVHPRPNRPYLKY